MAAYARERWNYGTEQNSDEAAGGSVREWVVHGTDDAEEAAAVLRAFLPGSIGSKLLATWTITERAAEEMWYGVANYGSADGSGGSPPPLSAEGELTIDTAAGGTKRVVHYRSAPQSAAASQTPSGEAYSAPDHGDLIHVTDDGVEGTEIEDGPVRITVSRQYTSAQLPSDYFRTLVVCRNKVNSHAMTLSVRGKTLTFQPGELKYHGASLQYDRATDQYRVSHVFDARENENSRTIRSGVGSNISITTGLIKGWDYVWVHMEKWQVTLPNVVGKVALWCPAKVYWGPVYETTDLTRLGA